MLKIGHRGSPHQLPENTLASLHKALEYADGVEFDIRLSKDGVPVVIHDETLERTTSGHGYVRDHNFAELQKLDTGSSNKIPALSEIFEKTNKRAHLLIELKDDDAAFPVARIIDAAIRQGWSYANLFVLSFNHPQLLELAAINPAIQTCASIVATPVTLALFADQAAARAIAPALDHASAELVTDARNRGLKVFGWTVNSDAGLARARSLKIDAYITDYPNRL